MRSGSSAARAVALAVVAVVAVAVVAVACGRGDGGSAPAAAARRPLVVAAASDLRFVFEELEAGFERRRPDVDVRAVVAGSGTLAAQIANGAPYDVFLSADSDYPAAVVASGAAADAFVYATGYLSLIAARDGGRSAGPSLAETLTAADVRKIAVANPAHAPYGKAAMAAFDRLGIAERVRDRLVFGENVAQAAQFVETGAAQWGVVARGLASSPRGRELFAATDVPRDAVPPLRQSGVLLKRAAHPADAEEFCRYLREPAARAVFTRYGYGPPE